MTQQSDLLGKLGQVPRWHFWFALLAAPLAWFAQINLGLAFTPLACGGNPWPLYVLNAAVLLIAVAGLLVALRLQGQNEQPQGVAERVTRYLGRFSAWGNAIYVFVVVMTGVVTLLVQACRLS